MDQEQRNERAPGAEVEAEEAADLLKKVIGLMGITADVRAVAHEDDLVLEVSSLEAGRLIGRQAHVLEALELILKRMLGRSMAASRRRLIVDVEGYRERRKERLQQEAFAAAEEALRTGQPVMLAPMNAQERRLVHQALAGRSDVATHSEASTEDEHDPLKRIVVQPSAAGPDSPPSGSLNPADP